MQASSASITTQDLLRGQRKALEQFFAPTSIAVIGATEAPGSVGRTTLWNLVSSPFGGTVYPVNPKRPSVLGIKAYASVKEIPGRVDLAVICSPASTAPQVIRECAEVGIRSAIIISAGFKEAGPEGIRLEQETLALARAARMRIIGPNCLGVMCPPTGVNATFAHTIGKPGNVAFISQSGALATAVLDWSLKEQVGFSAFVSLGSMADVSWGDLIDYFGADPKTRSILMYMETVGDARSFLSAAREVALSKPIIIIKAGRTAQGGAAAASHTGSLTGSDEVLDAAFNRCGVLRVNTIADLFYMAEALAKQPRPRGPRLAIVTNAGGPAVLATDALVSNGGELAVLSDATKAKLNEFLPASWSHGNPVDILGDAPADRYAKALEVVAADESSDGMLVILTPQAMTDATMTADLLKPYAKKLGKPVLASWMGGPVIAAGEAILNSADIPTFNYPDTAARAFTYMWSYTRNLQLLYQTPAFADDVALDAGAAEALLGGVRAEGRTLLTEHESKLLLKAYGIETTPTEIAESAEGAVLAAEEMGYPVVLKLHSLTVTHKTDAGGVQLNLRDAGAVREAFRLIEEGVTKYAGHEHFQGVTVQPMIKLGDGYELILGSSLDAQFGPVMLFGMGGQLVEVFKDKALALPPLNATLARRMMERTKIFTALQGVRGRKPVDLEALGRLMVRFSRLIVEQRWIKEIDINPLLATPERLLALDARVVLHEASTREEDLPKSAIRPYPVQYVSTVRLKDGREMTVRPIRPEDEPMMVKFHQSLSERTVYLRYLQQLQLTQRIAHERLIKICFNDYDRELALVAEYGGEGERQIAGVTRLTRIRGSQNAEMGIIVSDEFQGQGLGRLMLEKLVAMSRSEGVKRVIAEMAQENVAMQHLCQSLGFELERDVEDPVVTGVLVNEG